MKRFLMLVAIAAVLGAIMAPAASAWHGSPPSNQRERRSKVLTDQQQVDQWAVNLERGWKAVVQNSMNKVVAAKYLKGTLPDLCGVAAANSGVSTWHMKVYVRLQQTVSSYGFAVVC